MFFRRRQKAPPIETFDDFARTIAMVGALVDQEQADGRIVDDRPRQAPTRAKQRLHSVAAD